LWAISVFVRVHAAPKTVEFSFAAAAAKLCEAFQGKKIPPLFKAGEKGALYLLLFKHVLANSAQGACEARGKVIKLGARGYAVVGISGGLIILVAADSAYVLHFSSS
jgi:hypothetical protein